jgi:hypothetical protein
VGGEGGAGHGPAAASLALEGGLGAHVQQQQVGGAAAAAGQADEQAPAPAAGAGVVHDQAAAAGQGEQDPQAVLGVDQRPPQPVGEGSQQALPPGPDRLGVQDQRPGGVDPRQQGGLPGPGDPGHHQQGRRRQPQHARARRGCRTHRSGRGVALGRVELHHVGDGNGSGGKPA